MGVFPVYGIGKAGLGPKLGDIIDPSRIDVAFNIDLSAPIGLQPQRLQQIRKLRLKLEDRAFDLKVIMENAIDAAFDNGDQLYPPSIFICFAKRPFVEDVDKVPDVLFGDVGG